MDSKIRILQVTNSLNFGGLERLVVDLCLNMDSTRFEPSVACLRRKGNLAPELEAANIPVVALNEGLQPLKRYITFYELGRLIKTRQIHVVHTHNTGPLADMLLTRLIQFHPIPVIHTDHTRPKWPDKRLYMMMERLASRVFEGMVAVSEEAREMLVLHEGIDRERIQIIDNGINVPRFEKPSRPTSEWLREIDASHFDVRVGLLSMHRRQKGIGYFLQSIPEILRSHPNTGFIIGGGGPLEDELENQAAQLGIGPNTRFIGRRSDVADTLWAMDIYVLPSESEGLPIGLLEAMAARRCIVATAVGAVPEVLDHGACGLLIPPRSPQAIAEAVCSLLGDKENRESLSARAYSRVVQQYSIQRTVDAYQALYDRALASRRARK